MADHPIQPRWGLVDSVYLVGIVVTTTMLVALFGSAYYWVAWRRMAQTCQPHGNSREVSFSHTWTRGFICTSGDGHQQAKFWW